MLKLQFISKLIIEVIVYIRIIQVINFTIQKYFFFAITHFQVFSIISYEFQFRITYFYSEI